MKKKKKLPNGAFLEYFDNIAKEKRIDRYVQYGCPSYRRY